MKQPRLLFSMLCILALAGCSRERRPAIPLQAGVTQNLSRVSAPALYWVDQISSVNNPFTRKAIQIAITGEFHMRGWAVDPQAGTAAGGVELVLDGKPYQLSYGLQRWDVADVKKNPAYLNSGFDTSFPATAVGVGEHRLSLRILDRGRKSFYETPELLMTAR